MRPLAGVRVLDASSYVSGPFAALVLADLGAEVTKVEAPTGDPFRKFGVRRDGLSLQFAAVNANKRSITLDLKSEAGVEALRQHLADSDVLVTNWRPAVAARMGLTEDAVRSSYPRLVWARVSGYGQTGPFADRPAFDYIAQARGAAVDIRDDTARFARGYLTDKVTAMFAAQAVLAALVQRGTTGEGAVIDVAMLDALAYFNGPDLLAGWLTPDDPAPDVERHVATSRPVRAADGWMVVIPVSRDHIRATMEVAGHPEWADELREIRDPTVMVAALFERLDRVLPARTCADWEAAFAAADVPATAVLGVDEHLADPQVAHNRIYEDVAHPVLGRTRRARHPALFGGEPVETDGLPSPELRLP